MFEDVKVLISGNFQNLETKPCGVYAISGLAPSNSFQCPVYIGSSFDILGRFIYSHIPNLMENTHRNPPLQNYYNKYGIENLVFFHLESCTPEDLLKTEQKYIDHYGVAIDKRAFNILPKAGSPRGVKRSEEFKEKMRQARKNYKTSEETKKKISESLKKLKFTHGRTKFPGSGTPDRKFKVIDPTGKVIEAQNVRKFCRDNDLDLSNFRKLINNQKAQYIGWTNFNKDFPPPTYKVVPSPGYDPGLLSEADFESAKPLIINDLDMLS